MKNVVFWDINTQFVLHRRHITSPLQSPDGLCYVRFAVFTAVIKKNAVFWDVVPCGSCRNGRIEGPYHFHLQGDKNLRAAFTVSSI
jgi:hypothetical protein